MSYAVTLQLRGTRLEELRQLVDPAELKADLALMLRKLALVTLRQLVLTCSVDTGRARGGFLALLDKYGVSAADLVERPSPYQTVAIKEPKPSRPGGGVEDGRAQGEVLTDSPEQVTIVNAVDYVEFINTGTGRMHGTFFMDSTLAKIPPYIDRLADWYIPAKLAQARLRIDPDQGPGDMPT